MFIKIQIHIGERTFTASFGGSPAIEKLIQMTPLTLKMKELNGSEKYGDLPKALPTDEYAPGVIQMGDIMLYGSRTIVIFYASFNTPYRYTKIGKIEDTTGLKDALGAGNVVVELVRVHNP